MKNTVKSKIVRIGNSRGLRIPKVWLDQLNLGDEVEMAVEPDQLVIRAARKPRERWDEAFRVMAEQGDDRLVEEFPAPDWDEKEWRW
jgi:antitoxin MazE